MHIILRKKHYALVLALRQKNSENKSIGKKSTIFLQTKPLNRCGSPLRSSETQCTTQSPCILTKLVSYKHIPYQH